MKVCVLQVSYDRSEHLRDYATFDPPRDLTPLVPEWSFTHAFLHKATAYRQLRELAREGFDVFVNLCEGHLDWDVPSIDVIHALESLGLPHTGPSVTLYEPRKDTLKLVAHYAGVATPRHAVVRTMDDVARAGQLGFPLFVKPLEGGDSFGIDDASLCTDEASLQRQCAALLPTFGALLVEQYVGGREFSVLVAADPADRTSPRAFTPIEFRFPDEVRFKTYALKNTEYHPTRNVPVTEASLVATLQDSARRMFVQFAGVGYCRLDFRLDDRGTAHVLDANFTCSVFYPEGAYGTADYILAHDPAGPSGFLRHIVAEGLARHAAKQRPYRVRTDGLAGMGIEAARDLHAGEVVFRGEERPQRLATRGHVTRTWSAEARQTFDRYAYPVSEHVSILWSEDPRDWAPQNHACVPNTGYVGLDVVALSDVRAGEELTLDYATFLDETAEPFQCTCGHPACRGIIRGTAGNSVEMRERG